MLKNSEPQYIARGIRIRCHAPWISHLLFAEDCLIFTEASQRNADIIASILDDYHKGSGQLVNKQKSVGFFSDNCEHTRKQEVHSSLSIPTEALGERYLGLPTTVGRSTNGNFDFCS